MKHATLHERGPEIDYDLVADRLCYKLFFQFGGTTIRFATDSAIAQVRLRTAYGNFLTAGSGRPAKTVILSGVDGWPSVRPYLGYSGSDWVVASNGHSVIFYETDEARATFAAIGILHHLLIRYLSENAVVLHAAVLRVDDRTVLVPGRAGIGKSTVAASLVGMGFSLLSDELAPVDPGNLKITPCPLPIGLRNSGVSIGAGFKRHVVGEIRHTIGDEDRTIYELERAVVATDSSMPALLVLLNPEAPASALDASLEPSSIVPLLLRASYNDPIELRTFDTCVKLATLPTLQIGRTSPEANARAICSALEKTGIRDIPIPA